LNSSSAHLLRQSALVQLSSGPTTITDRPDNPRAFRADSDGSALLALQRIDRDSTDGCSRAQNAAAAAVVEEGIDGFLPQHSLFVSNNHIGRVSSSALNRLVAIDHAAIQVVQSEVASVRHPKVPGPQFGRDYRNQSRIIHSGLFPDLTNASTTFRRLQTTFSVVKFRSSFDAKFHGERVDLHALEEFLDGFRAHHGDESAGYSC